MAISMIIGLKPIYEVIAMRWNSIKNQHVNEMAQLAISIVKGVRLIAKEWDTDPADVLLQLLNDSLIIYNYTAGDTEEIAND